MKHTPGPWGVDTIDGHFMICGNSILNKTDRDFNGDIYIRGAGQPSPFGLLFTDLENRELLKKRDKETNIANAKLIAAAPDLLEACQVSYNQIELEIKRRNDSGLLVPKGLQTAYLMLSDSINKATGAK